MGTFSTGEQLDLRENDDVPSFDSASTVAKVGLPQHLIN